MALYAYGQLVYQLVVKCRLYKPRGPHKIDSFQYTYYTVILLFIQAPVRHDSVRAQQIRRRRCVGGSVLCVNR